MACFTRFLNLNIKKAVVPLSRRFLSLQNVPSTTTTPLIKLSPFNNSWIYRENNKIEQPSPLINKIFELPNGIRWIPPLEETSLRITPLEMPSTDENSISKEAARLIVIRRRKMKRHKLKKLRIRMKFEWAKRRQRRELKKEKAFQAVLIQQCKDGEAFSAEKYVEERLQKLKEVSVEVRFEKMNVRVRNMKKNNDKSL